MSNTDSHYWYTVERALIYSPELLAQGYENDTWSLIYSFADYDHALEYMRADAAEWGKVAKHRVRDTLTDEIIATE